MQQTLCMSVGIVQYFNMDYNTRVDLVCQSMALTPKHPVPSSDIVTEKLEKPKAFCYT